MSSLKRMLAVFDVFTPDDPSLTADEIIARLGYSRGTAYRYIRELTTVGLLARTAGRYSLGPRIIELDYFIRENDPNLQVIQPVMRGLTDRLECDSLWASFFGQQVVVTHHEHGTSNLTVSYGRGRRLPLFRGAGSKVIIAALPAARQRNLYANNTGEIAAAGLGASWNEFKSNMAAIRRAGHSISRGELDHGNVGIAAPITLDPPNAPGSFVLIFGAKRYATADEKLLVKITMDAAAQIGGLVANLQNSDVSVQLLKKPG